MQDVDKAQNMIEEMEEVEFDNFYSEIEEFVGKEDHFVSPDSKIDARKWLFAVLKLEDEISFLKKEYIPALEDKYIRPVKEKINKHDETIGFLKEGIYTFLKNSEATSVNFPDMATVSLKKKPADLLYPEDEKTLAEKLGLEDSPFVKKKFSLDKMKIKDEWKRTGAIPIDGLASVDESETIAIRKAKK